MLPGAQAPAAGPALTAVTCPALAGASAGIGTCGLGVPAARARAASLRGSSIRLEEGMGFSVLAGAGWALRGAPTTGKVESANTAATSGERLARPAHCDRWVASPSASRTRLITPNVASVVKP